MLLMKQIISSLLAFISFSVLAQDCNLVLRGVVLDDDNRENLSYAVVRILTLEKTVQTNDKGEFEVKGLCAGNYRMLVQHIGCPDTIFEFRLDKSRRMIFKMPHSLHALNDIEVVASHDDPRPTQAIQTLEGTGLDRVRGQDLAGQLRQLNGVTTFNTGPTISRPMVNGMQGYRILLLNNGVRQEGQQWGSEHAPEIDPFTGQKLTVLRGASAVRYGSDAIGGVILVEPGALPDSAAITGEYQVAGFSNGRGAATSLQLQGAADRLKYFSWRIQGSLKGHGDIHTPGYYLHNTGLRDEALAATVAYHRKRAGISAYYSHFKSRIGIFSGAHAGNLADLQAAFSRKTPGDSLAAFSYSIGSPYQGVTHELLKITSDIHTGSRSRVNMTYAFQYNFRQEFDSHSEDEKSAAADFRLATHFAELGWEHDYIRSFRGRFGIQGMYQENVYRETFYIPNYIAGSAGVFVIERFVRPNFELEGGIRADRKNLQSYYYLNRELVTPEREFNNLTYHAGLLLKPIPALNINVNFSSGWRAPAVNELYSNGLHHGVGAIERGNQSLLTEYSKQIGISSGLKFKRFTMEATAYHYMFENYIYYKPSQQPQVTVRGVFPVFTFTQDDAEITGADVLLNYHLARFVSVKGRGMWIRGVSRAARSPLRYIPAARYEAGCSLNLPKYRMLRDNYFECVVSYVSEQTRVPDGTDFVPPPPAYILFGFNLGTVVWLNKQAVNVNFSVSNAGNTVYRDYLDRLRYFTDAAGRNFTLRLKVPFTVFDKK
jgi:iron complex outermembrane recepter protein